LRVSDYIANRLSQYGVKHVYGLVGGGAAGLNDGFISHPDLEFVCFHHEQGAGYAAVGAARTNRNLAVVNVTTGCGGTNAVTSCLDAWQESVPVLFISGNTSITNTASWINQQKNINLRRYGLQEHNIVETVQNLTKYAVMIKSADDVAYELEKAIDIATSGRPGPVWIDVPGNVQTAQMSDNPKIYEKPVGFNAPYSVIETVMEELVLTAKRPVIVAGAGINIARIEDTFREFIERFQIPFVTTFLTKDLIETDHHLNIGMIGIKGNRAANFAMQNSDLLLILGSSMNVSHIGYDAKTFSPHSKKIMVDVDNSELKKGIINVDVPINCDVGVFLRFAINKTPADTSEWLSKIAHWKNKWPLYNSEIHRSDVGGLNLYEIVESINRNMQEKDTFIVDAGQPCYILPTNGNFKKGTRFMAQAAQGDMGYAVPALVGVHKTNPSLNIVAVVGEGSFYTNVQELAVTRQHNIPAKIFVINNDGYMSIKQTQTKFFQGRLFGVSDSTGVYFADIAKIADAYEIEYLKISTNKELDEHMPKILHYNKPIIVEFISQDTLDVLPAQAFKPNGTQGGLHDMAPFLTEDELAQEMIVKI
jgi:acetolactate synthase-1/2/3 large subunit